jgi:tRNA pseudouridine38-40 synthase
MSVNRYFLKVAYDGTAFHGSQIQGEQSTVQGTLNKALHTLFRKEIETFGASRTDEGVHALGNFYHFDLEEPVHPQLVYKMNALLPPELSVMGLYQAKDVAFNARFDALSRRYRYKIYQYKHPFKYGRGLYHPYPLEIEKLQATAAYIKEQTDFESFCKRNAQNYTFKCTILDSHWELVDGEFHYIVEANRFLRGMVRALVGTQLKTLKAEDPVAALRGIFEANDCTKADFSVSGNGLYLEAVNYPEASLEEMIQKRKI